MSDWTPERVGRLRALWAEGLPVAEIGRRMGMSKNAVVGKAHRLKIAARPSPIRAGDAAGPAKPARSRLAMARATGHLADGRGSAAAAISGATLVALGVVPAAAAVVVAAPVLSDRAGGCRWPLWPNGARPTHRYCAAPTEVGCSWCPEHLEVVADRVTPRTPAHQAADAQRRLKALARGMGGAMVRRW